jgi:hypothetical protein
MASKKIRALSARERKVAAQSLRGCVGWWLELQDSAGDEATYDSDTHQIAALRKAAEWLEKGGRRPSVVEAAQALEERLDQLVRRGPDPDDMPHEREAYDEEVATLRVVVPWLQSR